MEPHDQPSKQQWHEALDHPKPLGIPKPTTYYFPYLKLEPDYMFY